MKPSSPNTALRAAKPAMKRPASGLGASRPEAKRAAKNTATISVETPNVSHGRCGS